MASKPCLFLNLTVTPRKLARKFRVHYQLSADIEELRITAAGGLPPLEHEPTLARGVPNLGSRRESNSRGLHWICDAVVTE